MTYVCLVKAAHPHIENIPVYDIIGFIKNAKDRIMSKIILGKQLILDFYGCDKQAVNSEDKIKTIIGEIAALARVTIVSEQYHSYEPYGITGIAIVSESHISLHTWPEYDYLGVDIFSCKEFDEKVIITFLERCLGSTRHGHRLIDREAYVEC